MKRYILTIAACCSAALLSGAASAQDEALYDPVPPPDSAYVRVIDAECEGSFEVGIGARSIPVADGGISFFVPLPAGSYPVTSPGHPNVRGTVSVAPGKAYSIVVRGRSAPVSLLEDTIEANPDKSAVYLYNLTPTDGAELFVPKAKVSIISSVASEKSGYRSVNAVTVDAEVRLGGKVVETVAQQTFRRRSGQTYVVCEENGMHKVVHKRNEAAR
jgi:alginate O-acetyltransferase complex protein AlgF